MTIRRLAIAAAVFLLLASPAARADDAPVPLTPDQFDLTAYAGRVVLVDFWASWCKPCAKALPWVSELAGRLGEDGLTVVAVNLDEDLDAARAMLADLHPSVVLVHDPEGVLAKKYSLQGMPSTFVHDRAGALRFSHVGFLPAEAEGREAEVRTLLTAKGLTDEG